MELINIVIIGLSISILVLGYRLFTPSGYKEKRGGTQNRREGGRRKDEESTC